MDSSILVLNIFACACMLLIGISSVHDAPLDLGFFSPHSIYFTTQIRRGLLSHCNASLKYLASTDIF